MPEHNTYASSTSTSLTRYMLPPNSHDHDYDPKLSSHHPTIISHTQLPTNMHPMVTRSKKGIFKCQSTFVGLTINHSPTSSNVPATNVTELPVSVTTALNAPIWYNAMKYEFVALQRNNTWSLIPATPNINLVGSKWIFKIKDKPYSTIKRHKTRLVSQGFHQTSRLDFFDTISPMIKFATIRIILTISPSLNCLVH